MKIYSKLCEYGIRALLVLAQDKDKRLLVKTICRREHLPIQFTRKALHALLRKGYVSASRGPTGGYVLKRSPEKITLWELVEIFDDFSTHDCPLGQAHCSKNSPCGLHAMNIKSEKQWIEMFKKQTLATLLRFSKNNSRPPSHDR